VTETSAYEHRRAPTPRLRDTPKTRIPWGIRDGQPTSVTGGVFFAVFERSPWVGDCAPGCAFGFGGEIATLSCASTAASAGGVAVQFTEGAAGRGESSVVFPFADGSLDD